MNGASARGGSARLGLVQVCTAGVLWGTGGLVVTELHRRDGLGAMTVSAWRMLLAAVALLAFVALTRQFGSVLAAFRTHPGRVALVGCGTAAYQGLYFVSVLLIGVSVSTVVSLGLAPLLASAWEHTRQQSRPSGREAAVLTAALTGLILITGTAGHGTGQGAGSPAAGLALAVLAGATYAATTLLGQQVAQSVDPVALTTGATTVGALALTPFLLLAGSRDMPIAASSTGSLALLVYLGVVTMALSYGLLYAGLKTISGSAATIATLVEPVSAAVLAALLLSERMPPLGVLGAVLILSAVIALRPAPEPQLAL